jgi:KDO2-lipid IV(A) lauroyltransferase
VTESRRRLEAPHRRLKQSSRLVEKVGVWAYRTASWVIARVPERPARALIGLGAQLSYLLWPAKRRWSNANFGHVLGLPPGHPRVRRLALAAYREYARYLVEVMRLPRLSPEQAGSLVPSADLDAIEPIWQRTEGGIIFALGHVGNNEAVAAGVAWRGWPISVVADDSAFPELYEDFRRLRESWGIRLIPWRNLREIYAVLRRREMLGLLVDWGYRDDGIPVRLFDAWTTLPAGPALLAARTRSTIVPIVIRRADEGHFHVEYRDPITVASSEPAELARATQRLADALAESIRAAPEQWYSFKPIWPDTAAESAALERRALEALAGSS